MDVEIFRRSRTFIRRYQLLDLMRTIISGDSAMPTEARTVDYFVDRYMQNYSFVEFRQRRLIHNVDADSGRNTSILRHPRPIHRGEVYSVFAEHCEWILNEPWVKRTKMLNLKEWEKFCEKAKKGRKSATGMQWGLPSGVKLDASSLRSEDEPEIQCLGTGPQNSRVIEQDARTVKTKTTKKVGETPLPRLSLGVIFFAETYPFHSTCKMSC
jgi:hypothetical protein